MQDWFDQRDCEPRLAERRTLGVGPGRAGARMKDGYEFRMYVESVLAEMDKHSE
jgi:hypothetical protein